MICLFSMYISTISPKKISWKSETIWYHLLSLISTKDVLLPLRPRQFQANANVNFEPIIRGLKNDIFDWDCEIWFKIQLQKKKMWSKNGWKKYHSMPSGKSHGKCPSSRPPNTSVMHIACWTHLWTLLPKYATFVVPKIYHIHGW